MSKPKNANVYGDHQEIHIGTFQMDRVGLVSGSVQVHKVESQWGDGTVNNPRYPLLSIFSAPNMGIPCVGCERTYKPGRGIYTYTYEGVVAGFEFGSDNTTVFELEFSMNEESIQTHPQFEEFATEGQWDGEKNEFPFKINADPDADPPEEGDPNPWYGVASYLVPGAIYRKTYISSSIPASAQSNVGKIFNTPPGVGVFNVNFNGRKWLKLAPRFILRGNVVQVSEEYMLSATNPTLAQRIYA